MRYPHDALIEEDKELVRRKAFDLLVKSISGKPIPEDHGINVFGQTPTIEIAWKTEDGWTSEEITSSDLRVVIFEDRIL
jgi:hypothetical protein